MRHARFVRDCNPTLAHLPDFFYTAHVHRKSAWLPARARHAKMDALQPIISMIKPEDAQLIVALSLTAALAMAVLVVSSKVCVSTAMFYDHARTREEEARRREKPQHRLAAL